VRFCHGAPGSDELPITRITPDERLRELLAGVDEDVVVCGHTHVQFDRALARHRIVNAGSVGMPFAGPHGAYWLLLADGVHLRRTDYDIESAAARLRKTRFRLVEDLVVRYVLSPPAQAESLKMLAAAELQG